MTVNLSEVMTDVSDQDLGVQIWVCNGISYKIPLLNGDLIGQAELLIVADKYDDEISGTPTQVATIIGSFMYELLKLNNDVSEREVRKIANPKTVSEVYGIWLGNR